MTNATQREESAERLARPLIQLAKASGLSTSFFDQLGTYTEISDEALVADLNALEQTLVYLSSRPALAVDYTSAAVQPAKGGVQLTADGLAVVAALLK